MKMIDKLKILVACALTLALINSIRAGCLVCDFRNKPVVITQITNNMRTRAGVSVRPIIVMFGLEAFNAGPLEPPVLNDNFTMVVLNEYWEAATHDNILYSGTMDDDKIIKAYLIVNPLIDLTADNQHVQQVRSLFTITPNAIYWDNIQNPVRISAEVRCCNERLQIRKPYVDLQVELTLDRLPCSGVQFARWPQIITATPD